MATLPAAATESQTVARIYAAYEAEAAKEPRRGYLGASQIGRPCDRELWHSFRHCGGESFDGRMLRLFATGDWEELRFVKDLRAIGCEVHDVDPDTGEQFEVSAIAGHFSGHMDGAARGIPEAPQTWHVLEFKTHNAKSFGRLKSSWEGVKLVKPEHYCQMMMYMHLTGMRRALYLAVNKDTDELYAERVRYDKGEAEALIERAESIIQSSTPPAKISEDRESWHCRFCSFKDLCHGHEDRDSSPAVPCTVSCRNCVHATPELDTEHGRWSCARHSKTLSRAEQDRACPDHLFIPDLVTFAEPVDSGGNRPGDGDEQWIEYRSADGTTWRQGKGEHHYSSAELTKLPGPLVGAGMVGEAKQVFGCTVEGVEAEVSP